MAIWEVPQPDTNQDAAVLEALANERLSVAENNPGYGGQIITAQQLASDSPDVHSDNWINDQG